MIGIMYMFACLLNVIQFVYMAVFLFDLLCTVAIVKNCIAGKPMIY